MKILGITDTMLLGTFTTAAMPAAANTAIFAERYNGNSALHKNRCFFYHSIHDNNSNNPFTYLEARGEEVED